MKYEQIAAKVADHLKVQPTHLRFFPCSADGKTPRQTPIKRISTTGYVVQQFTSSGGMPLPPIVFYEVLEMSLTDMESRRDVTITWLPEGIATLEPVKLFISRQATFEEVVSELVKKQTSIPSDVQGRIRLFDIRGHKDYKEYLPSQALTTASIETSYGANFYAEVIPQEEAEMSEMDRCVIVIHFAKELLRLHGIPVKFVIKPVSSSLEWKLMKGELWYDTKKRLQKRLGYKEKEFAKIKFFFIPEGHFYSQKLLPLEEGSISHVRANCRGHHLQSTGRQIRQGIHRTRPS
jgi:ubiquitin carboxyl-terminal hydrolase 7